MEITLNGNVFEWTTVKLHAPNWTPTIFYAGVRDYNVDECIIYKKDMLIRYRAKWMYVPWESVFLHMYTPRPSLYPNKTWTEKEYPYRTYLLIDMPWKENSIYIPTNIKGIKHGTT